MCWKSGAEWKSKNVTARLTGVISGRCLCLKKAFSVVRQNLRVGNLAHITVSGTVGGLTAVTQAVSHCHTAPLCHSAMPGLPHCQWAATQDKSQAASSSTVAPNSGGDASTDPVGKGGNGRTDCDQPAMHNISTSEKDSNPGLAHQLDLVSPEGRLASSNPAASSSTN